MISKNAVVLVLRGELREIARVRQTFYTQGVRHGLEQAIRLVEKFYDVKIPHGILIKAGIRDRERRVAISDEGAKNYGHKL